MTRPGRQPTPGKAAHAGVPPRLHERARDILAARIEAGALAVGERLLESRVAEELGISRAPVRQALASLEAAGLVERSESHGYRVVRSGRRGRKKAGAGLADDILPLAAELSWERIHKDVERAIVARTAYRAWRVLEPHLADYYGVSRTVAREVLARLQQRGVVKRSEKARWYAPALTPDYVAELYEMRWLLEPVALIDAGRQAPRAKAVELLRSIQAANANSDRLDGAMLTALETELHFDFLGHCRNRTLLESIRLYQSLLIAHDFLYSWAPDIFGPEPFLPEHLEIATRLAAGRIDDAGDAMEQHLRRSLDRAITRLESLKRGPMPAPLPYLEAM